MDKLVLYTNPQSRGRIAHWMLEELGLPYDTVWLDYGPPMKSPDYLAVNPMGKVPALKHGAAIVTETPAICAYLADRFPAQNLIPPVNDPRRAARCSPCMTLPSSFTPRPPCPASNATSTLWCPAA